MGFAVFGTNAGALRAYIAGFKTRREAENFCAMRDYKMKYFGVVQLNLIIEEV